jgi:LPXTG-motif cell wall-anchored protein
MKRKLIVVLCLLALVLSMASVAFAADAATFTTGTAEGNIGEEVTIEVKATSNIKLGAFVITPSYDKSKLEFVKATKGSASGTWNVNKEDGTVGWILDLSDDEPGHIFENEVVVTYVFKIADDSSLSGTSIPVTMKASGLEGQDPAENQLDADENVVPIGFVDGKITVKAHTHTWDAGKVTKAATCAAEGEKTFTCTACGETKTEKIAKTTDHKWDAGKVTTAATCEKAGVKTYTCTVCGTTKTEEIKALGHKWDAGKVTKEATCGAEGEKTLTCQNDPSHTKVEKIAATGKHTYGEWEVTVEAQIGKKGEQQRVCTVCGNVEKATIPALLDPNKHPQTGDNDNIFLWAGIFVVAVAAGFVFMRKSAKKN